jgi:hypothetical protein
MDDPVLMDRLLELINSPEEPVEVQEEATFALASLSRDRTLCAIMKLLKYQRTCKLISGASNENSSGRFHKDFP